MSVDYTPILKPYSGISKFHWWCHKILPLVYDESLSYYELLCKVVDYLNNVISDLSNAETNIDELKEAYVSLQNYVNSYFDNLDVAQEINDKLDEMASDGTLTALVNEAMRIEHLTLKRKLLPMTGTLRFLNSAERISHYKILGKEEVYDPINEVYTTRRIRFNRGEASFTINFNPDNKPQAGMISLIRGYGVGLTNMYGDNTTESEYQEFRIYVNGHLRSWDELVENELFTDIMVFKRQNQTDYFITVCDASGIHLFMKKHVPLQTLPHITNVGGGDEPWTDFYYDGQLQIAIPTSGNLVFLEQDAEWNADEWHHLTIHV